MRVMLSELRRRRVFRTAGMYVVAAWLVVQIAGEGADAFAWVDRALRPLWITLMLGFPIALLIGWRYDLIDGRIVRTPPATAANTTPAPLQRIDYLLAAAFAVVVLTVAAGLTRWTPDAAPDAVERSAGAATPAATPIPADLDTRAVAVLPFRNLSGTPGDGPLVEGLHEDVLTQVAKVGELRVIASTSVNRIEPGLPLPQIAALLGVGSVLDGTIRRSGDDIRVNVKLIDVATERTVWAERFDRKVTASDLFDIQSEIAASVADAMHASLSPRERSGIERAPTQSLAAHEAYLLGNKALKTRTVEALREAVAHFNRAIELDPGYALAYVRMADATLLLNNYGGVSLPEAIARTDRFIAKALAIDPDLGPAHATAALSLSRQSRPDEARRAYERAIALDPNHAPAFHWYGDLLLVLTGQVEEALPLLERARELDPLAPVIIVTLGEAYEALGRFDEAMALYRKALSFDPDFPGTYWLLGMYARFHDGRLDEAMGLLAEELRRDPSRSPVALGYTYLDLGDDVTAEYWFRQALRSHPDQFWTVAAMTDLYRFRGDAEQSLAWAQRLDRLSPFNNVSLMAMLTFGEDEAVLASFRERFPQFSCERPAVNRGNVFHMIHLSLAMERTGQALCANNLLEAALDTLESLPRLGWRGYQVADVLIHARLGATDVALEKLDEALRAGVRALWSAHGVNDPHLAALEGSPRFAAAMDSLGDVLASQLQRVREMEASGQLPTP